ncbi:hypothetical protein BZA05DRAFT_443531 [Tricharina praecox]|uniref:uncharacterized protein n=1 Tax=Tricharina praecox TaxID=43433 RepID=UPI00221FCBD2|nr:uncharacterized protein BZA05DRAFT_443531 [Tricharina praecox]KAI5854891.1 hypothetical protein BZA05DRAFT_443531 [Tricharina praecox]
MLPQLLIIALAAVATALPQAATPTESAVAPSGSATAPTGPPAGIPEVPECLIPCFLPAIKASTCKMADGPGCLCKDETFTSSLKECVSTSCKDEPDVIKKAEEMAIKGCAKFTATPSAGAKAVYEGWNI